MIFYTATRALVGKARPMLVVGALSLLLASTLPTCAQAQAIPDSFKILPGSLTPDQKNPFTNQPDEVKPAVELPKNAKEVPVDPLVEDESLEAPVLDPSLTRPIKINEALD